MYCYFTHNVQLISSVVVQENIFILHPNHTKQAQDFVGGTIRVVQDSGNQPLAYRLLFN